MAAIKERPATLVFQHPDFEQRLEIDTEALRHLHGYQQHHVWSREAGGQIFGSVDADVVRVLEVNGPRRTDERSRTSFRSDPIVAQRDIDHCVERGLVYLGEWHTHPEPRPTASIADLHAFSRLLGSSRLRANILFLLIQGTAPDTEGVAVHSGTGIEIKRWASAT
jgi:integrative and conjugative element protein (TIGR02256 family)